LVLFDVSQCKDTDAYLSQNIPFLGDAIRLAGVVDETSEVSLFGGVDDLPLRSLHQVSTRGNAIRLYSAATLLRVNCKDLPDVLHDEVALANALSCTEPPTLTTCRKGIHESILMLLELPVLA